MEKKLELFKKYINKSQKILLINHIKMDGDAFGSLSAFYYILKSNLNKEVKAINDEQRPNSFYFLDKNQIFEPNLNLDDFNPDLIISFDAASEYQLGNIFLNNKDIFLNTFFIVIDHHITNKGFGNLNIIDSTKSSTCELLFDILVLLGFKKYITPKIATLLNSGLITDTNIYYNQNTTSNTLNVGAELIKLGSNFRGIIYEFYKKRTFYKIKLLGKVIENMKKVSNGEIVYSYIKNNDFLETSTTENDTIGLIDNLINIDTAKIAFIVYPLNTKLNKVSFRSKEFNVGRLCENFGGGGHKFASGFSTDKDITEIINLILIELGNKEK